MKFWARTPKRPAEEPEIRSRFNGKDVTPDPGTLVKVLWHDASSEDDWQVVDRLLAHERMKVVTVGLFVGETVDGDWVIASGFIPWHGGPLGSTTAACTWFIPRGMVIHWGVYQ